MTVEFHNIIDDSSDIKFVVIQARYQGKWIFVRHKNRTTWEMPGGHVEPNEAINDAARRELWEESGSQVFELTPICNYSVNRDGIKSFGRLYFAEVESIGELPEHEIVEVSFNNNMPKNLTYKEIQPYLYEKVVQELMTRGSY